MKLARIIVTRSCDWGLLPEAPAEICEKFALRLDEAGKRKWKNMERRNRIGI